MLFLGLLRAFFTFTGISSSGRPVPPPRLSRSVPPFARRGLLLFALLCLSLATVPAGGAAAQEVMFSSGTYRVTEGDVLRPELVLSHARSEDVTVRVEALDLGEAKSGEDFAAEPWHVTIPAGRTRQTFSIATVDDGRREHTEQFLLHIAPYGHSPGLQRSSGGNADAVAYIVEHTGIWLSRSRYTVWEGGTANIGIAIDNPKPAAFTLDYTLSSDTASDADMVGGLGTRSVTVPAYARYVYIRVETVQDTIRDEDTESVSVRLSTSEPHVVFGRGETSVSISDDDTTLTATFASSSSSVDESVGTHHVTVKLSPAPVKKGTLRVNYARLHPHYRRPPPFYDGSTATPGSDYEIPRGKEIWEYFWTLSIPVPAGATTVTFPVTIIDDHEPEDDETVILRYHRFYWDNDRRGYQVNRRVTPHRTHTLTIVDDDLSANPVVSFVSEFQDVDERAGAHDVTLHLSTRSPSPVTVNYTVGGTATPGSDYAALSGTVTVPAGARTATVPVTIPDDGLDDAGETVVLTLSAGEGYRVGSRNTHRLNIDVPPVVYFPSVYNRSIIRESAGTHNVTVNLSAASTSPVTVNYTVGGTATPGSDYAALSGTVTVPAGTIKASIPVTIIDDTHEDSRETIVLTLAGGTGYRVVDRENFPRRSWGGPYSHHTLVIVNHDPDDVEGQVQAQLDAAVAGGDSASANLWRRALAAIRGEAPPSGLVPLTAADAEALAAGHSGKGEVELASLWTEIAGVIGDSVTPLPPAVTLSAGASPVTEGGDAVFTLTADPAPASDLVVTVTVAAEGDFGVTAGERTVTVPATGSATLTLTTTGDDADETDGSVTATVKDGDGYTAGDPASGTVSVQDDDEPPPAEPEITVSAGDAVTEGGDATFTLTADPAPAADLAVTVAVAVDGDYGIAAGEQTVTVPATGSATLTLTTTGDEADETDGSVTATVTDGEGYTVGDPASGTVAVQDDDEPAPSEPEVTISAGSSPVTEGGDAVFTVTANPAPGADLAVTVTVAVEGDFGVTAGERTMTVPAAGSATLTLATTGDDADEPDGSVSVTATVTDGEGYTVGDPASGTVAIADDDPATVATVDAALVAEVTAKADGHSNPDAAARLRRIVKGMTGEDGGYTAEECRETATRHGVLSTWKPWCDEIARREAHATPKQPLAPLPEISISVGAGVTEGGDAVFTVTASPAPAAELAVTVTVAAEGDFGVTAGSQSVTVPTTGSAVLTLATANDEVDEADGSVSVTVAAGEGYTVGDPASGTVSVQDDDAPLPGITIAAGTSPVTEGGDAAFTVTASPAPAAELAVTVTVAVDGDYGVTAGKQTVTIPATGSATLTLATAGDDIDEPDGSVSVTVATGNGYTVGDPASGTVAVQDDDVPAITVSAGDAVTEGGDAVFTVTANPAPASPLAVSVTVAVRGDYGIASGTQTVSIPATGSAVLTLATSDDAADEPDGSVSVTVAAGEGYTVGDPASGSVSIADDDLPPPAVSITATAASVTEGGAAAFTLTADRAPDADLTVTLSVAETGGGDHVAAADEGPATAVIAKGATEAVFSVATVDDDVDESDGSVTVTLKDGGGYTVPSPPGNAAAVTVSDDDAAVGPVLSIGDETGKENGRLPAMPFTVRLSAPAQDAVRVYVSTRPSTPVSATPKVDYTPASYYLLFRAGETEKQVWVMIHNDSHDEEPETFEVVLSKAQGAPVGDGVAVATIVNDDPMPAAWLARFGRAVAEQALDGIAARMTADRTPGLRGTIAGQALDFGGNAAVGPDLSRSPGSRGTGPGLRAGGAGGAGPGLLFGSDVEAQSRGMTMQEALRGSSFSLTGEADGSGGTLSFWGGSPGSGGLVSGARFAGNQRGDGTAVHLSGETGAALLGTDYARGRWLVGFALSQVRAEGGYASEGGSDCSGLPASVPASACAVAVQAGDGEVEASLTATIPYAALAVSERLRLWGAAGQGAGDVTVKTGPGGSYRADTAWSMAAAGLRGDLLAPPAPGPGSGAGSGTGPALALTSDALWVRTSSEKTGDLAASESDVNRLRVGLEGSWGVALSGGGSVTPKLELGARHDGGDAETGFGVELGGGLAWRDPGLGLTLDLSGRTLVAHDDGGLEDRGVSARLSYDPEPSSGRGLSLSLGQDWGGRAQGGLDALFQPEPLEDRAGSGGGHEATSRWAMEAAWGLPVLGGRFTGSPYMGLGLATGARDYSLGWRLTPEAANAPGLSFGLRATRRESDAQAPEHTVGGEIAVRW